MKRREVPSDDELRARLHKRMFIPATGPGSHPFEKRFNRQGVPAATNADVDENTLAKGKAAKGAAAGNGNAGAQAGATNTTGPTAQDIIDAILQNIQAGNGDTLPGANGNGAASK